MQRVLKRVPLDFDYPLNTVWHGYNVKFTFRPCISESGYCEQCKEMARLKGIPMTSYGCPDNGEYYHEVYELLGRLCEPPAGDGYQLWETCTEGSPVSPVFGTLEELSEWCSDNYSAWGHEYFSKNEWMDFFQEEVRRASGHDEY